LDKVEFMRELYPTAQTKISKLTDEKWECPYYQEFYSVSFERQPGEAVTTDIDKDTVVIHIDAQGNYTVNSMELMDNEAQTLKDAVKTVAATSPPKVVVKTETNTPKVALDSALHVLYEMGVKKTQIVTP
jgi:biopolymer transport protein ExbD